MNCTKRERELIEIAVNWRSSDTTVAEAIHERRFWHAVDMVLKERRDVKAKEARTNERHA